MTTVTTMRAAADAGSKAMPRKINFTLNALARVTCPPERRDVRIYDAKTPGLAFIVTGNGSKAFYFYKWSNGRPVKARIGGADMAIDQARRLVAKMSAEAANGNDPTAARRAQRQSETLQELFDRYTTEHLIPRCSKRTQITDASRASTCLTDLAHKRILSVTEADVRALHLRLGRDKGHVTANRAVQMLRRLFNWARIVPNPATKAVTMYREQSRERFAQPAELPKLFKALDGPDLNPLVVDFIRVALFTGARRSYVAGMRMEQINLAAATWTIPAANSKNHQAMTIPLTEPALAVVKRRWGHPSGYIFPSDSASGHLEDPKATWKKVLERAELTDLTIHDLRRTFGSFQAAMGASLPVIGRSLGHRGVAATAIYSRLHLDPVRASVTGAVNAMLATANVSSEETQA